MTSIVHLCCTHCLPSSSGAPSSVSWRTTVWLRSASSGPPMSVPSSSGFLVILSPPVRELTSASWVPLSGNSLRAEKFRALADRFLSFKKSSSSQNTTLIPYVNQSPQHSDSDPRGSEGEYYWGLCVLFKTQGFLVKVEWGMGLASEANVWLLSLSFINWRWLSLHIRAWLIHSVWRKLRVQIQCWGKQQGRVRRKRSAT